MEDPDEFESVADFNLAEEQEKYADFLSFLDDVKARFERYYDLDPLDLTVLAYSLGGQGFRRAAPQQMACTRILAMAAQAFHDAVTSLQDDLLEIADASIAEFNREGGGGAGGLFTVVSFIAGAVGLFLPTGASQVAGVISLGSGIASVFAGIDDSGERREWTVSGPNAPMILESIRENLVTLAEIVADKDQQMAGGLDQDLDSATAFASADLRLPEPTGLDSDGFGVLTVDTVVDGIPISENKVVVSIASLYEAGFHNLPYAAHYYEQAVDELVEPIPDSVSRHFFRARSAYQLCRARLREAVSDIRWHLTDAGDALVQIATDYELTDQQGAEVLRQIGQMHEPVLSNPVHPSVGAY